jgi:hypothetical protein
MGHSDATLGHNNTVPLIVWGNGVPAADLYALNPAYADPGGSAPGYAASAQPIRNMAVANLALDLLDLPAVPRSQSNTAMNLTVYP